MTLALLASFLAHPLGLSLGILGVVGIGIALSNFGAFTLPAAQSLVSLCGSQFTTDATVGAFTLAAGEMTGTLTNYLALTAAGAVNVTTRTAVQLYQDLLNEFGFPFPIGASFEFQVINSGGGTVTIVGGTGVTVTGTATVANNTSRVFCVTVNSSTTMTLQDVTSATN